MKNIVILGAGTGGTVAANALAKRLDKSQWAVTVVDKDDVHYYQPGFLFLPFGLYNLKKVTRKRSDFIPKGVVFKVAEIERIVPGSNSVLLQDGTKLPYDYLVVATGVDIMPDETPGLRDAWRETAFDFYTPDGATALAEKLASFKGGRLAVHINEMPVKCPVAPLEFAFLSDWYFTRKKMREAVEIVFVTPLSGAFTKPVASKALGSLLDERHIRTVVDFGTERVDAAAGKLVSYDGREVAYDLLVTVPTNMGAEAIERSGMGDEFRFVPTNSCTLRANAHPNVYVLGDAANIPASKAGSSVHFQAETLVHNLLRAVAGDSPDSGYDGHANCFVELGYHKAALIDFNYDVEPLPGRFPFPVIGPMPLLKPSRLNHLGKLAFRWMYWNLLLKARPIPFIPARMSLKGKRRPPISS